MIIIIITIIKVSKFQIKLNVIRIVNMNTLRLMTVIIKFNFN